MAVITYREALNHALREEMERDDRVFLIGEEVGVYGGAYKVSQGLLEKFGERRVVDTPICESGFTGVGIGAAMVGLRPVVEMMTFNFALVALDQIVNHAAKLLYMSGGQFPIPMVIREEGLYGVTTEVKPANYVVVFEVIGEPGAESDPVTLGQLGVDFSDQPGTTEPEETPISASTRQWLWLGVALGAASLSALAFWVLGGRDGREIEVDEVVEADAEADAVEAAVVAEEPGSAP